MKKFILSLFSDNIYECDRAHNNLIHTDREEYIIYNKFYSLQGGKFMIISTRRIFCLWDPELLDKNSEFIFAFIQQSVERRSARLIRLPCSL